MNKHDDCEDRCQLLEHKGYHGCSNSGRCVLLTDTPLTDKKIPSQSFVDQTRLFDRCYFAPLLDHARALHAAEQRAERLEGEQDTAHELRGQKLLWEAI